jgi:hypothetical protein
LVPLVNRQTTSAEHFGLVEKAIVATRDTYLTTMRWVSHAWFLALLLVAWVTPAAAKVKVDFNPEIDFSKYKTFAYIGGVENLVMQQLNPELIQDRVHRAVSREMTAKGLREVQPGENPDLLVRYWASSSIQVNFATLGNWGPYGAYVGSYWGYMFSTLTTRSEREASLLLDLIDPRIKDLVWRLYIIRRITDVDKVWKKADEEFTKGFQSYPPSAKEIAAKRKERSDHQPKQESFQ